MSSFCYWTIGDGEYGRLADRLVQSARAVGVTDDFHVWSDRDIGNCVVHKVGSFLKAHYLFKLRFLKDEVCKLDYDYFVFLDADNFFVRKPDDVLSVMQLSPIHVSLESCCFYSGNKRPDWWGCPLGKYDELMRSAAVS